MDGWFLTDLWFGDLCFEKETEEAWASESQTVYLGLCVVGPYKITYSCRPSDIRGHEAPHHYQISYGREPVWPSGKALGW